MVEFREEKLSVGWIREDFQKELILNLRLGNNGERKGFSERRRSMGKACAGRSQHGGRSHMERCGGKLAAVSWLMSQACCFSWDHVCRPHTEQASSLCLLGKWAQTTAWVLAKERSWCSTYLYIVGTPCSTNSHIFPYVECCVLLPWRRGDTF